MNSQKPVYSVLERQFGHPSGPLGTLIGVAMAIEHSVLHRTVVNRLSLSTSDRVLEVGFGPGTAIKLASMQAGFVAGIEPSREMVAQAMFRNKSAIRAGRVEILRASAEAIPFPNDSFSVVYEVNSFSHWESPERGLAEIFRVLRFGGRLMMVLRKGHGELESEIVRVVRDLSHLGFKQIGFEEHSFGRRGVFITARK